MGCIYLLCASSSNASTPSHFYFCSHFDSRCSFHSSNLLYFASYQRRHVLILLLTPFPLGYSLLPGESSPSVEMSECSRPRHQLQAVTSLGGPQSRCSKRGRGLEVSTPWLCVYVGVSACTVYVYVGGRCNSTLEGSKRPCRMSCSCKILAVGLWVCV